MGFTIKTSKCRSLSIQDGKPVRKEFSIKDRVKNVTTKIFSVLDKPMKFLGSEITELNTAEQFFELIKNKIKKNFKILTTLF